MTGKGHKTRAQAKAAIKKSKPKGSISKGRKVVSYGAVKLSDGTYRGTVTTKVATSKPKPKSKLSPAKTKPKTSYKSYASKKGKAKGGTAKMRRGG